MKEIGMLLHIPNYMDVCTLEILKQIRHLKSALSSSHVINNEWWQLDFDDCKESAAVYTNDIQNGEYWNDGWKSIRKKKVIQVSSILQYENQRGDQKLSASISAILTPYSKFRKMPRENGERWISLRMTARLWQTIDQEAFIQCIKEMYFALNATYACIDEEAPLGGIHEGSFRFLANLPQDEDLENRLPGIYWLQIVACDFVDKSGGIARVLKSAPCEGVELIERDQKRALLLKITSDIKKANRRKRLAMREYFKDSLYTISLNISRLDKLWNVGNWKHMSITQQKDILRRLQMMPLNDYEISEILEALGDV